eukprot:TRINITY_DN18568_c0_g1::TRINITY_DN18568_c0_g1_i1::g.1161::m.1161 TRINITY_DN18568_c0_g1::TRINITY_DN18568_c0_g1_i1::g.1161  ORF type:complete len:354 (-),score=1.28,tRNA_anti-codon/PF01336.20/0.0005,tRNA_anti-codon/PF01336.20/2.4e+03 TRINITY_DN18568_c0_g1_i1:34-1095(-)
MPSGNGRITRKYPGSHVDKHPDQSITPDSAKRPRTSPHPSFATASSILHAQDRKFTELSQAKVGRDLTICAFVLEIHAISELWTQYGERRVGSVVIADHTESFVRLSLWQDQSKLVQNICAGSIVVITGVMPAKRPKSLSTCSSSQMFVLWVPPHSPTHTHVTPYKFLPRWLQTQLTCHAYSELTCTGGVACQSGRNQNQQEITKIYNNATNDLDLKKGTHIGVTTITRTYQNATGTSRVTRKAVDADVTRQTTNTWQCEKGMACTGYGVQENCYGISQSVGFRHDVAGRVVAWAVAHHSAILHNKPYQEDPSAVVKQWTGRAVASSGGGGGLDLLTPQATLPSPNHFRGICH